MARNEKNYIYCEMKKIQVGVQSSTGWQELPVVVCQSNQMLLFDCKHNAKPDTYLKKIVKKIN